MFARKEDRVEIIENNVDRREDELASLTLLHKNTTKRKSPESFRNQERPYFGVPACTETDQATEPPITIEVWRGKHCFGDETGMVMQK